MELLIKALLEKKINLKTIFNSFSEGLVILDETENVLFTNESVQKILKVQLKDIKCRDWPQKLGIFQFNQTQLLGFDELPMIRALKGTTLTDHLLFIKNDEHLRDGVYISVDASPLKNEEGKILGAMATFRDISKQLLSERKVVKERAFFEKLLDFIPAHIIIKDLEGHYIYTNKHFNDFFPINPRKGETIKDYLPPQKAFALSDQYEAEAISTKKEVGAFLNLNFKDGRKAFYRMLYFPIFDNDGGINGVCILAFDETQKHEEQKAKEIERIKYINASKLAALGTLAAEIGHEINNPLGIIKTSVLILRSMLENSEPIEELKGHIDVIDSTTKRITDIVSALKHVSRDSTKEDLSKCTLDELLNDVKSLCSTRFRLKNINLEIDDSEVDLSDEVHCLRVQISQVLLNVLLNAADAIEVIKDRWVKIKILREEDFYYFKITDSGSGVPEEIQERLFEPFFTTKVMGMGTGLGLSIAKDIMKRQSGDIYLDLTEGPSCFVIKLPKQGGMRLD